VVLVGRVRYHEEELTIALDGRLAQRESKLADVSGGAMIREFRGKAPRIASTAFVSEEAYVIGDVEIGENSSVWPGAVIRGDFARIRIGNNTQIEDNCVMHSGVEQEIGDNVHIGHGAVVHCSKVGNNVLIGIQSTLLDGVEIGDYCVIGAYSLVLERTKIPSRSFVVGRPSKIKGEVTDAQVGRIEAGVEWYLDLTRKYKEMGL
jgi:carbonic anhydrase/acetyltransferase-like protein (isoleucine patch superfamily)